MNHGNKCPACGKEMLEDEIMNSLSRYYKETIICNECGTREAFEGQFWAPEYNLD